MHDCSRRAQPCHVRAQSEFLQTQRVELARWRKPIRCLETSQRLLRAAVPFSVRIARVKSPALERCMSGVLERMVLPPHRGAPIEVSYPMNP